MGSLPPQPKATVSRKRPTCAATNDRKGRTSAAEETTVNVESPGGLSPQGAPRSVREPLDSYGSQCSAASMAQLPVGKERWIYPAEPVKPISCSLGLPTQLLELAVRPADEVLNARGVYRDDIPAW